MRRVVGAVVVMAVIGAWNLIADWSVKSRTAGNIPPVFIPSVPATPSPRVTPPRPAPPVLYFADPLVFLSTAPADSLDLLPGVGPVLAARTIDARRAGGPFRSWKQVLAVKGIGPRTVARWQSLAAGQ